MQRAGAKGTTVEATTELAGSRRDAAREEQPEARGGSDGRGNTDRPTYLTRPPCTRPLPFPSSSVGQAAVGQKWQTDSWHRRKGEQQCRDSRRQGTHRWPVLSLAHSGESPNCAPGDGLACHPCSDARRGGEHSGHTPHVNPFGCAPRPPVRPPLPFAHRSCLVCSAASLAGGRSGNLKPRVGGAAEERMDEQTTGGGRRGGDREERGNQRRGRGRTARRRPTCPLKSEISCSLASSVTRWVPMVLSPAGGGGPSAVGSARGHS